MGMKLIVGALIVIRIFIYYYNTALTDIHSNFSVYFPFFNVTTYLDLAKFVIIPLFAGTHYKAPEAEVSLFTEEELKKYNGKDVDLLYIAILGNVFDVTSGSSYYGVGKVYHGFTGKDGSRAFISGEFTEKGLTDDVLDLSGSDLLGLEDWVKMYERKYIFKGKLIGRYYDHAGHPTEYSQRLKDKIQEALISKAAESEYKEQFPPCNVEWTAEKGSRVWCSARSGGVERNWIGVPRKLYVPGNKSYRCACVNTMHQNNSNNGKISDSKYITEYEGCDSNSHSCFVGM